MSGVGKVAYKVIGIGSGLVAAKLARTVLDRGWEKAKGGEPPRNPAVPGTTWSEAVTWAVASGIALSISRMLATKGVASAWRRTTGHLPPGVEDVGN